MSKKAHILSELYRNSPQVANRKATMTEIEEFARWFVELVSEFIIKLEDGKISLNEYPDLFKLLWGSKDAFTGLRKFDDEWKQAQSEDFLHLADTILTSITTDKIPKDYLQLFVDTAILNYKFFKATRTLLGL